VYKDEPKVKVVAYQGLTVDYCKEIGAQYMIRGIRSTLDFEYEKAIAQMNHAMHPDIESIIILSKPGFSAISSTIVRDILRNGGNIDQFVPKAVAEILKQANKSPAYRWSVRRSLRLSLLRRSLSVLERS
jgi:pantetheine-phosphate adenylyltransferase